MAERELSILVRAKGAIDAARNIGKVDSAVGRLSKRAGAGLATAGKNLAVLGAAAAVGVGAFAKAGIESLAELEDATSRVEGAIVNAGLAGQLTAQQVAGWANKIEADIGAAFDDKEIVAASEGLIRYGKVAPQNLEPAMVVMTDLAARVGNVGTAGELMAKALADPTKAAGKLSRYGIILTKEQQKQIKAMVKAGDVAGAQALLLDELSKSTKGAAAASQGPYRRSLSVLADVTEDAQRALGEGFLPVITKVADLLQGELAKPSTIAGIRAFGTMLASGLDDLIGIARSLPWGTIGTSLQIAGAGAKAVLGAFASLPSWVQTAVLTGWGLNKLTGGALGGIAGELAKGLIKGVLGIQAGVVNVSGGVVNGGGVPGAAAGAGAKGALANVMKVAVVGSVVVAGLAVALGAIQEWATQNQTLKDQGLNQEEIAAMRYYQASAADQATMAKRLGRIPSRADYDSALAKLAASQRVEDKATQAKIDAAAAQASRNGDRLGQKTDNVARAQGETKRETARGLAIVNNTTRSTTLAQTAALTAAIRASKSDVIVNVNTSVTAAKVTQSVTKQERAGKSNGSYGGGDREHL